MIKLIFSENLGGPSVVPVEHARPMRSECLRRCPNDCPTNTIELMEANCKPSCRKGKIKVFWVLKTWKKKTSSLLN